jgi:DNA-3-methyladenine glycosylase
LAAEAELSIASPFKSRARTTSPSPGAPTSKSARFEAAGFEPTWKSALGFARGGFAATSNGASVVFRRLPLCYPARVQKLPRAFYDRDTVTVARELLGKHLVHRANGAELIGRIVEVEAYIGPHDLASHSSRGLTARTRVMYGPPGHAYVYLIYGVHCCMNVVTEREGHGAAVLLRAVEPVKGIEDRTCGPGLLCRAMRIDRRLNAHDLLSDELFIAAPPATEKLAIVKSPRIGVDYAQDWAKRHLRFYLRRNPFVSRRG